MEATHLCETALQLKGKEPQFHLNLAEVYVAAGRRASAIATLEWAIEKFLRAHRSSTKPAAGSKSASHRCCHS